MPRVGLLFELRHAETQMGESIRVVGDQPALGNWLPLASASFCEALELRTSSLVYPRWTMRTPVWLNWEGAGGSGLVVEYKFVRHKGDGRPRDGGGSRGSVRWEDRISNRRVTVPEEDGGIFLVSDARWESDSEPAQISRLPLAEIAKRWASLDPEGARHRVRSASAWARPANFALSPVPRRPATGKSWGIEDEFRALSPDGVGKAVPAAGKARDSGEETPLAEQSGGAGRPLPFILRRPQHSRGRAGYGRQRSNTVRELERLKDENRELREASVEMLRLRLENGALRRSLGLPAPGARTPAGLGVDACDRAALRCQSQNTISPSLCALAPEFSQDSLFGPPRCTLAPALPQGLIGTPSVHKTPADAEEPQTPGFTGGQSSSSYAEESPEGEPAFDSPRRCRPCRAWTARSPVSSDYAALYGKVAWAEKLLQEPQEEPSIKAEVP